jgi:acyl carrier protein
MKKTSAAKGSDGQEKLLKCVYAAIDAHNKSAGARRRLGKDGKLDSLGLVNFIVAVEERLSKELGAELVLADSRAMSQKSSPFRTVKSLVDYVGQLLKD